MFFNNTVMFYQDIDKSKSMFISLSNLHWRVQSSIRVGNLSLCKTFNFVNVVVQMYNSKPVVETGTEQLAVWLTDICYTDEKLYYLIHMPRLWSM